MCICVENDYADNDVKAARPHDDDDDDGDDVDDGDDDDDGDDVDDGDGGDADDGTPRSFCTNFFFISNILNLTLTLGDG